MIYWINIYILLLINGENTSESGVTGTDNEYFDFTVALYGNWLSDSAEGGSFLVLFISGSGSFRWYDLLYWLRNPLIRSIQVDNNQFVDSMVNPDIISIANSASRREINEDVIVLVITAKHVKNTMTNIIKGVSNIHPMVVKSIAKM